MADNKSEVIIYTEDYNWITRSPEIKPVHIKLQQEAKIRQVFVSLDTVKKLGIGEKPLRMDFSYTTSASSSPEVLNIKIVGDISKYRDKIQKMSEESLLFINTARNAAKHIQTILRDAKYTEPTVGDSEYGATLKINGRENVKNVMQVFLNAGLLDYDTNRRSELILDFGIRDSRHLLDPLQNHQECSSSDFI